MTAVELFAGAGGLAIGSHEAGFRHLAVVEVDRHAAATVRDNSKFVLGIDPSCVLEADVRSVDLSCHRGMVDLLAGGPPCQPFSHGGMGRGHTDERNMFPSFISALETLRPRAVLIENVAGLLRPRFTMYWEYILSRLHLPTHAPRTNESWEDHLVRLRKVQARYVPADERYEVRAQILDAADFGVPQRRKRVMIVGYRGDLGITPRQLPQTHSAEALLREQWITGTYWQRHRVAPHEHHMNAQFFRTLDVACAELPDCMEQPWLTVRDAIANLPSAVPRGGEPRIANHIQHPGARPYKGHCGSVYDGPAKALKAGAHGTPGGENTVIDPKTGMLRYFTIREAARLQTFPDNWEFRGSWSATIKQLGNAVPVDIAACFASEIFSRLATHDAVNVHSSEHATA